MRTSNVFMMLCIFCGAGEARNSICEKCAAEKDNMDDVIKHYFHRGYPYDAIVGLLEKRGLHMTSSVS